MCLNDYTGVGKVVSYGRDRCPGIWQTIWCQSLAGFGKSNKGMDTLSISYFDLLYKSWNIYLSRKNPITNQLLVHIDVYKSCRTTKEDG